MPALPAGTASRVQKVLTDTCLVRFAVFDLVFAQEYSAEQLSAPQIIDSMPANWARVINPSAPQLGQARTAQ